jgi:hypothetical protein
VITREGGGKKREEKRRKRKEEKRKEVKATRTRIVTRTFVSCILYWKSVEPVFY